MIVMSKQARILLAKLKEYAGDDVEYDILDIEWHASRFLLQVIEGWWKYILNKRKNLPPPPKIHTWWLPPINSSSYRGFLGYTKKSREKNTPYEFEWNENSKQVYHYLCSNYLNCDFNPTEFKKIIEISDKYSILNIQSIAEKKRNSVVSIDYLKAIPDREAQAKDVEQERINNKIIASHDRIIMTSARNLPRTAVALMRREFEEIKNKQDSNNMMKRVKHRIKK